MQKLLVLAPSEPSSGPVADFDRPCLTAEDEEEVQPGGRQLAVRPADMTFEQAMRHYMDEIAHTARDTNSQLQTLDNRQVLQYRSSIYESNTKYTCMHNCCQSSLQGQACACHYILFVTCTNTCAILSGLEWDGCHCRPNGQPILLQDTRDDRGHCCTA